MKTEQARAQSNSGAGYSDAADTGTFVPNLCKLHLPTCQWLYIEPSMHSDEITQSYQENFQG